MACSKDIFFSITLLFAFLTFSGAQNYNESCIPGTTNPCTVGRYLTCVPRFRTDHPGTCRCQTGAVHDGNACIAQADAPCRTGGAPQDCVPGSECQSIRCTCLQPYRVGPISNTGELYCKGTHGADCAQGQQCDTNLQCMNVNPNLRQCRCPSDDYVWSQLRNKCLMKAPEDGLPGISCSRIGDNDCIDNARCISGNCVCASEFEYSEVESQCRRAFSHSCSATNPCNEDTGAICNTTTGHCACRDDEVREGAGRFARCKKLVGGECIPPSNDACGGGTTCHSEGFCFCNRAQNKTRLDDNTCGDVTGGYAGHCESTANCGLGEYLNCTKTGSNTVGVCLCQSGMTNTPAGCRHLAGENCPLNHGCVTNSACIYGKCVCLPGTTQTSDGHCLKTHGATDDYVCSAGDRCNHEEGLECSSVTNGRCVCPTGQEWSGEAARCVALVSGNCLKTENLCTEHATCTEKGICECSPGYSVHYRLREDQPTDKEDDKYRICLPTYNSTCDSTSAMPCNDEEFLTCDSATNTCKCEFPFQQEWDSTIKSCAALPGASCGQLPEIGGTVGPRVVPCLGSSTCEHENEADVVGRCNCNLGYSLAEDEGRCERSGAMASIGLRGFSLTSMVTFLGLYAFRVGQ